MFCIRTCLIYSEDGTITIKKVVYVLKFQEKYGRMYERKATMDSWNDGSSSSWLDCIFCLVHANSAGGFGRYSCV